MSTFPRLWALVSPAIVAILLSAGAPDACADGDARPIPLPVKEKFQIYLLIGQSNMAGRGKIGAEDTTPHPRVLMFTPQNQWAPAAEPITHDKPAMLGVGPGLAFGKAMADKNPEVTIGLLSCAFGGTPLKRWERGGDLYSNAVVRTRIALRDGRLAGILWHQGESDAGATNTAYTYGARLAQMIQDLRADLGATNTPFVAGQIGEFLYDRGPEKSPYARVVNEALAALPQKVPATACVPSKGLKDKGDVLHFDAESQREFGKRYAAEMLRLQAAAK